MASDESLHFNDFWNAFVEHDVLIVSGGTGSGKTTQIPQFVAYMAQRLNIGGRIACTQPRDLAAVKVAERVAQEAGCELGAQVGYQIHGDDKTSEETRLIYVTDGLMVAQAFNDRNFNDHHTVFIDEAHERNKNIHLLMALARRVVKSRENSNFRLKVIIMSATINVDKHVEYFKDYATVTQVHMPGATHKVRLCYLGEPPRLTSSGHPDIGNIVEEACRIVANIARNKFAPGSILVFMPGSDVSHNAILSSSSERRRCIVSTNIAETSITIPDIVYVIDTGIEKVKRLMPRTGAFEVRPRPNSKAIANQRAGRCGRTRPGVCFRMYTEQDFERNLRDQPDAEIARDDVSAIYLKALTFGFTAATLQFIDPPPFENLAYANELLLDLGYINDQFQVTNAGKRAAQNPFEPNWNYAIEFAKVKYPHVAHHIVALAAMCSSMQSIFLAAPTKLVPSSLASRADPMSDLITELNALYAFEAEEPKRPNDRELDQWCDRRSLNRLLMEQVLLQRDSMIETMEVRFDDAPEALNSQDGENIRKTLARTFFRNIAFQSPSSKGELRYHTVHGNFEALIAQESMLSTGEHPWVMYDALKMGRNNLCMERVTHIEPGWIADLPFFQDDRMKRNYHGNIAQWRVKEALDKIRAAI
ncbi:unnamed protein product [Clonostachys chloroleuca]|uniref:P-loop containing nucleoside triphosphate hydrolase protein n=1 Tax=Clonostachys chloroleuca TaxID=1926264 RepID=A0AA35VGR1_9HYPO|nr:unnamed protein product [Clonostachys chloroleuca]